jgi:hypothetical protein
LSFKAGFLYFLHLFGNVKWVPVITAWYVLRIQMMEEMTPDMEVSNSRQLTTGDSPAWGLGKLQNVTQDLGLGQILWYDPCNGKWM